ncbi:MAG: DNA cytosine methyltransferase [Candidatus Omnitrophica bacterium]|nr:DNA cytosine methyltransferase [Candidatus Omnitrophota bacterium]
MKNKSKGYKYPSVSLFTGAFGLDLGLEKAGFEIKACVEKDDNCVKTIVANRPSLKDKVINKDINKVSVSEILGISGLKRGEVFLVSGGPPCQPFSTVGRRESISSKEGSLFHRFLEIVWGIYPQCFIFENVKGILSAAIQHKPLNLRGKDGKCLTKREKLGSGWDFINKQFAKVLRQGKKGGYRLAVWELDAVDFGAAQKRKRVFIVGIRTKCQLSKPIGTYVNRPRSLKDVIGRLDGKYEGPGKDYFPYDKIRSKIFSENLVRAGENWTFLPINLQKKVMGKGWYATGGKVGFCRRLSWHKPSPTITTNPTGRATNLCHPEKPRPLNYVECALLQGFPKSWKFEGSLSQKYKQIGNAVPVQLGTAIGKSILKSLEV